MKALMIALSLMLANITAAEASKREAAIEPYLSVRMIERELEPEFAPVGSVSIVDKSFRDLAFQKDSKFELKVDVI